MALSEKETSPMIKFSANLSMLFNEVPFLDRFEAASKAGFRGVEYVGPYAFQAKDVAARLKDNGLSQVLFNLPVGDWDAGERGIAIFSERTDEFQDGVAKAIEYAKALGCSQVNCLAGIATTGQEADRLRATLVANLGFAAKALKREGIRLLIEPINTRDMPGFFLTGSRQGLDLIDAVGSDNLYLQYDIYHMQIMEGDLARSIEAHLPRIGHIQIADNPGRHEPGTGEINYPFLFEHLERIGYAGWVGCEYKPATTTVAGLDWLHVYRQR
jgi:hydroxypyruvate isomerase